MRRPDAVRLERDDPNAVGKQQGGGDAGSWLQAAGRASGFEVAAVNVLGLGNGQDHAGAVKKGLAHVRAVSVDNPGGPGQDGVTVAAHQFGGWPGCWQATQLLRADGNPVTIG